jgi:DNA-binding NtrC family response regulator/pSer/pThr/pTyr-binding forkhead associated (FHA) protein
VTNPELYLIARTGSLAKTRWLIGRQPLLLGRESTCDVRIPDTVVSRRQCEISLVDGTVWLRELGGVNATFVNGLPVKSKCSLRAGDKIRIGRSTFLVDVAREDSQHEPSSLDFLSTMTLVESESAYLAELSCDDLRRARLGDKIDYAALFQAARFLARSGSERELRDTLAQSLKELFAPRHAWLMLVKDDENTLMEMAGQGGTPAPPRTLMEQALDQKKGELVLRRSENDGGNEMASLLVVPLFMGSRAIGVIALQSDGVTSPYTRADLDFLVALANVAAPLFKAVERIRELELEARRHRTANKTLARMVGDSAAMERVRQTVRVVAASDQPVFILGETGTGKELVASAIHMLSSRAEGLLVTVNCAAIPRELFESEFFGHEKGAFTGAAQRKQGLFEQSHGGTLFLDEIGDLSMEHQARILRAIETQRFRRVGGTRDIQVDFRILAATNKDIHSEMHNGGFRKDLFHRLRAVEITVPPLCERREDIPHLCEYFLNLYCEKKGLEQKHFSPEAIDWLTNRSWPGNVRELRNCVETAAALSRTEVIAREDMAPMGASAQSDRKPLTLAEMERRHIQEVLDYCGGKVVESAKLLGISKSKLYNWLAKTVES